MTAETLSDGTVSFSVNGFNVGDCGIDESVLLFLQMPYAPIIPLVERLRKFVKVHLEPGEKKAVKLLLTDDDFIYVDHNDKNVKLPCECKVMIDELECIITVED